MSMKRSKPRTSARQANDETSFWAKPSAPEMTWEEATRDKPDEDFMPYVMSARLQVGQLVAHAKFGRGVVVSAEAQRVEILFEDGKKKLGHGQS